MKKVFPVYILSMIGLLFVVGCGGDEDPPPDEEPSPPEPVKIININKKSSDGSTIKLENNNTIKSENNTIKSDDTIIVEFDDVPTNVKVNLGTEPLANQRLTWENHKEMMITGLFKKGELNIEITWEAGSRVLKYNVEVPPPPPQENMTEIDPDEFEMGSNDPEARNDEKPVHTVHVDKFFMDQYEVTNEQYKQFILANPSWAKDQIASNFHDGNYLKHWDGHNYPDGYKEHPIVYVSWYAAVAYAKWANKRLPTEAEWEYAARGGLSSQKYPWGDVIDRNKANYGGNIGKTTPKGKYPSNEYSLYDMGGNVWEWCLDEYNEEFYRNSPPKNPLSGADSPDWIMNNFKSIGINCVVRGGSWGQWSGVPAGCSSC